jgi:hypothetical protein
MVLYVIMETVMPEPAKDRLVIQVRFVRSHQNVVTAQYFQSSGVIVNPEIMNAQCPW